MKLHVLAALASSTFICFALVGCKKEPAPPAHAHEHVHGPHDGELIELGDEEFHAELVRDDQNKTVTIYLLDKDAKGPVTTAAPEVTITISLAGTATAFKLQAQPLEDEAAGKSSRFVSTEAALSMALDNESASRELSARIGERTYTGPIEHFEELHRHDHAHDEPGSQPASK